MKESFYAKYLAFVAIVEPKNFASRITKLSLQNEKLEKELMMIKNQAIIVLSLNLKLFAYKKKLSFFAL